MIQSAPSHLAAAAAAAAATAAPAPSSSPVIPIMPSSPPQHRSTGPLPLDSEIPAPEDDDAQLLASLWEHAPFTRLPPDAPLELHRYLWEIENPRRLYAVHRAHRRHGFQALVTKYIVQLRHGCDTKTCSTSTCFSYRKRAVGKAPIRRFNATSARALAIYLASQDNPEVALCPNLRSPKEPPAAVHSLVFTPRGADRQFPAHGFKKHTPSADSPAKFKEKRHGVTANGSEHVHVNGLDGHAPASPARLPRRSSERAAEDTARPSDNSGYPEPGFSVTDRPIGKDYRSFAANVFGTVAVKMLEWLTPNAVDEMMRKTKPKQPAAGGEEHQDAPTSAAPASVDADAALSSNLDPHQGTSKVPDSPDPAKLPEHADSPSDKGTEKRHRTAQLPRRNSNAKVRTSSVSKTHRKMSLEPFPPPVEEINGASGASGATVGKPSLISPKANGVTPDKMPRPPRASQVPGRLVAETVAFDVPPLEPDTAMPTCKLNPRVDGCVEHSDEAEKKLPEKPSPRPHRSSKPACKEPARIAIVTPPLLLAHHNMLPQSLSQLTMETVDFICNVLQEDCTAEGPLFDSAHAETLPTLRGQGASLERRPRKRPYPRRLKKQWRQFLEQGIFDSLSEPRALVRSFTVDDTLLASPALWYCMLRLTRVAPTLVLDSLWLASASLFTPPRSLQSPTRHKNHRRRRHGAEPLSDVQAAHLMSICLHALVAATPLVGDATLLRAVSDMRSSGLVLPNSGPKSSQPSRALCMQYNDVFSHDLALRLARRLFSALTARRLYADLADYGDVVLDATASIDVLKPLFGQIENSEPSSVLAFAASERSVYETRTQTLLLDWAKTVMMHEWDGQPEFQSDGPFGGALSLMSTMHGSREPLMVGDAQFRIEYFSDRLDSAQMPVAWLSFAASRRRQHLLDYPFIFSPASLVTYFRSINLSRMTEYYEEANTLPARTEGLDETETLLRSSHRKVMADMLRTASSRYFVLEISRSNILQDTLNQLWRREERELVRPLKVRLGEDQGEEGFDSGGVQQEFFRLVMAQCLDPVYGAFTLDDRTRMSWFVPGSIVETWKYEMIGVMVSLAVHNGLTLPITFPRALYRKLLGQPVCELHHIADGWPDLASGLTTLLEWDEADGQIEHIFARTYEFSVSVFGQPISRDMRSENQSWPSSAVVHDTLNGAPPSSANPADAPVVTNANRNAYVTDYIGWLTDVSVRAQFEAFERGFHACLHRKSLSLLTPPLLQNIIEGVQDIDIAELRRHTRYVGWDATHHGVRDFWAVVRRYDDPMKRKLLEFVTASDRVPVGGMASIQFVVQKNGMQDDDRGHLPTAYTCYGTLLLPEYRDRDVLRERLGMALENAQGFGFA